MQLISRLVVFLVAQVIVVASSGYHTGASCDAPLQVNNTITQPTNLTRADLGSLVIWSCVEGYTMEGDMDMIVWVCKSDGMWIGDQPNCRAVECGTPAIPAFATVLLNGGPYRVGDTITYQCPKGYTLQDALLPNMCMPDGSWTNVLPECFRTCPQTRFVVRYSNHTCFRRRALYQYKRRWDAARSLCAQYKEILATVKDAPTHRFLQENLQVPEQQLDPGKTWIGAREGQDWMWNHSRSFIMRLFWRETIFETNARECISLEFHSSADIFWWNSDSCSSVKNFICQVESSCVQSDFELGENSVDYRGNCYYFNRMSMPWERAGTVCEDKGGFLAEPLDKSTNIQLIEKARVLDVSATWWIGGKDFDINDRSSWFWVDNTRVAYFEWGSYEPNRPPDGSNCAQLDDGYDYNWNDVNCNGQRRALCQIGFEACGDPGEPTHGHRMPDDVTTFFVGMHIEFSCDPGYALHGTRSLTCLTNGTWNHDIPACTSLVCRGNVPVVNNFAEATTISTNYRGFTNYSCNHGYIPDGPPISRCQSDATWSIPNFTCTILPACYSTPCLKGGTCTDLGNGDYECACPDNFSGSDCDQKVLPACYSTPCLNGGTCTDQENGVYKCVCPTNFTGSNCNQHESQDGKPSDGGMVAGIAVAMIFLVIVIFAVFIFYRRRRIGRSKQSGDEHEMDFPDNNLDNMDPTCPYLSQPRSLCGQHNKTTLGNYSQDKNGDDCEIVGLSSNTEILVHAHNNEITTKHPIDQSHFNNPSYCNANISADHTYDQSYFNTPANYYNTRNNSGVFVDTVDQGNDDVHKCLDENIYANYGDDGPVFDKDLVSSATLPTTACEEQLEAVNGEVYQSTDENIYSNYEGKEDIADNPMQLDKENGEFYQNAEFHSVPSNLVENELYNAASTMQMPHDDDYDAVFDEVCDNVNHSSKENIYVDYEDDGPVGDKLYSPATLPTTAHDEQSQHSNVNFYATCEKEYMANDDSYKAEYPSATRTDEGNDVDQNTDGNMYANYEEEGGMVGSLASSPASHTELVAMIAEGHDEVYQNTDENIYSNSDDEGDIVGNLASPLASHCERFDAVIAEGNNEVYQNKDVHACYEDEREKVARSHNNQVDTVIAEGTDELYQDTDENIYENYEDEGDIHVAASDIRNSASASTFPTSNVEQVDAATGGEKDEVYQNTDELYANYKHKGGRHIKVDDEIYNNVASPSTFRDAEIDAVIDEENVEVSRNIDENIYSNYEDDGGKVGDGLCNSASPHTPYDEQYDAMVANVNAYLNTDESMYANYEDDREDILDNKMQLDTVADKGKGELYQNAEFHSVPSNLVENELYKSMDEI